MDNLSASELADKALRHQWLGEVISKSIAEQIKGLRLRDGLSQEAFAKSLGTGQSMVAKWESGYYDGYSISTLIRIAKFFDVALLIRFVGWKELIAFTPEGVVIPEAFLQSQMEELV